MRGSYYEVFEKAYLKAKEKHKTSSPGPARDAHCQVYAGPNVLLDSFYFP